MFTRMRALPMVALAVLIPGPATASVRVGVEGQVSSSAWKVSEASSDLSVQSLRASLGLELGGLEVDAAAGAAAASLGALDRTFNRTVGLVAYPGVGATDGEASLGLAPALSLSGGARYLLPIGAQGALAVFPFLDIEALFGLGSDPAKATRISGGGGAGLAYRGAFFAGRAALRAGYRALSIRSGETSVDLGPATFPIGARIGLELGALDGGARVAVEARLIDETGVSASIGWAF
jgi:hypothetical protein